VYKNIRILQIDELHTDVRIDALERFFGFKKRITEEIEKDPSQIHLRWNGLTVEWHLWMYLL
jgi:hypothetical protein